MSEMSLSYTLSGTCLLLCGFYCKQTDESVCLLGVKICIPNLYTDELSKYYLAQRAGNQKGFNWSPGTELSD